MTRRFAAGQAWAYAGPPETLGSRILIGAIVEFEGGRSIACCAVTGALDRDADGNLVRVTIPFLPLSLEALDGSVTGDPEPGVLTPDFAAHLTAWHDDPRGARYFTVPFEGSLDRMIGLQMAAIVDPG